jgi:phage terminase large subunit GpA-like protein
MSGFWYRVRAITSDNSSYAIDGGYLQTIEEVDEVILNKLYNGRKVWRCLIDIGGTKSQESAISKTEETYNWIRSTHGSGVQVFGSKGSSHSMATKIKIGSPIERTPSGKPIPGGLRIIQLNTDLLKDTLFYKIERTAESPEQPGGWWLYDDVPDWEIEQITAEEKRRERGGGTKWHVVRRDNHLLDCEVMCLAAADNEFWGGVALERKRQLKSQVIKPKAPRPRQEQRPNPYLEN